MSFGRPMSPRAPSQESASPRRRPQSAAAPHSSRMSQLQETNDALRRSYRVATLEQENEALRQQLHQLHAHRKAGGYNPHDPVSAFAHRRAPRRKPNLPITGAMNHDQMIREAKLRAMHNKQRQQLKGFMRGLADGNEYVNNDDLALAAKLAKMSVPAAIYQPPHHPLISPRRDAVPWRDVIGRLDYPEVGSEQVKQEAMRLAQAKRDRIAAERMKEGLHQMKVVEQCEDDGITEEMLREAHNKIREHFETRFTQVRKGFRILDEDGSGKLSYAELKSIVMMFNLDIPGNVVQKIIELADWNGDGSIDYAEFARIVTADDILHLKDTLQANGWGGQSNVVDQSGVQFGAKQVGTVKLNLRKEKKYQREGPAVLRPGVSPTELREAQKALAGELQEKYVRMTDAFKFIDSDRTGKLGREEIKRLMIEFNIVDIREETIENLIDFADFDGDGVINYAEFARVLTADDVLNMKQTLTAVAKGEKGAGGVGSGGLAFLAGGD